MDEIAPFLVASLKSDQPLPENSAAYGRRQEKIAAAAEPPETEPVKPLPEMAKKIDGKTYVLDSNPLDLQSIVLTFDEEKGEALFSVGLPENQTLELVIRDWGCGMEDVEQARQPLFTTGGEERSGMGFTIMESFMNQLAVKSAPGKGTTVTMRKRIASRVPAKR